MRGEFGNLEPNEFASAIIMLASRQQPHTKFIKSFKYKHKQPEFSRRQNDIKSSEWIKQQSNATSNSCDEFAAMRSLNAGNIIKPIKGKRKPPWASGKSEGHTMLALAMIVVTLLLVGASPGQAFCPSKCLCDDQSLSANCTQSASTISIVPMMLNPLLKRLTLNHLPVAELSNSLSVYRQLEYLNLNANQLRQIRYENFNFRPAPRHIHLRPPASQAQENFLNPSISSGSGSGRGAGQAPTNLDRSDERPVRSGAFNENNELLAKHLKAIIDRSVNEDSVDEIRFHLRELYLADNKIEQLGSETEASQSGAPADDGGQMSDAPNTGGPTAVRLASEELERLAPFLTLSRLESLSLAGNWLLKIHRHAFLGLVHLRRLDLSRNRLAYLDRHSLVGLVALEELRLNQNRLARHLSQLGLAFCRAPMNELRALDLSDNSAPGAQEMPGASSTTWPRHTWPPHTNPSSNHLNNDLPPEQQQQQQQPGNWPTEDPLMGLSASLPGRPAAYLQAHTVAGDEILLPNQMFICAPKLVSLQLSALNLRYVQVSAFDNLHQLQVLNLSRNNLEQVPSESLSYFGSNISRSLRQLDLSDTLIEFVNLGSFESLKNLQKLFMNSMQRLVSFDLASLNLKRIERFDEEMDDEQENSGQHSEQFNGASGQEQKQQQLTAAAAAAHERRQRAATEKMQIINQGPMKRQRHRLQLINDQLVELQMRHNKRLLAFHSSLAPQIEREQESGLMGTSGQEGGKIGFTKLKLLDLHGASELRELALEQMIDFTASSDHIERLYKNKGKADSNDDASDTGAIMRQMNNENQTLLVDLSFAQKLNCSSCQMLWLLEAALSLGQSRRRQQATLAGHHRPSVAWAWPSQVSSNFIRPLGGGAEEEPSAGGIRARARIALVSSQFIGCAWPVELALERLLELDSYLGSSLAHCRGHHLAPGHENHPFSGHHLTFGRGGANRVGANFDVSPNSLDGAAEGEPRASSSSSGSSLVLALLLLLGLVSVCVKLALTLSAGAGGGRLKWPHTGGHSSGVPSWSSAAALALNGGGGQDSPSSVSQENNSRGSPGADCSSSSILSATTGALAPRRLHCLCSGAEHGPGCLLPPNSFQRAHQPRAQRAPISDANGQANKNNFNTTNYYNNEAPPAAGCNNIVHQIERAHRRGNLFSRLAGQWSTAAGWPRRALGRAGRSWRPGSAASWLPPQPPPMQAYGPTGRPQVVGRSLAHIIENAAYGGDKILAPDSPGQWRRAGGKVAERPPPTRCPNEPSPSGHYLGPDLTRQLNRGRLEGGNTSANGDFIKAYGPPVQRRQLHLSADEGEPSGPLMEFVYANCSAEERPPGASQSWPAEVAQREGGGGGGGGGAATLPVTCQLGSTPSSVEAAHHQAAADEHLSPAAGPPAPATRDHQRPRAWLGGGGQVESKNYCHSLDGHIYVTLDRPIRRTGPAEGSPEWPIEHLYGPLAAAGAEPANFVGGGHSDDYKSFEWPAASEAKKGAGTSNEPLENVDKFKLKAKSACIRSPGGGVDSLELRQPVATYGGLVHQLAATGAKQQQQLGAKLSAGQAEAIGRGSVNGPAWRRPRAAGGNGEEHSMGHSGKQMSADDKNGRDFAPANIRPPFGGSRESLKEVKARAEEPDDVTGRPDCLESHSSRQPASAELHHLSEPNNNNNYYYTPHAGQLFAEPTNSSPASSGGASTHRRRALRQRHNAPNMTNGSGKCDANHAVAEQATNSPTATPSDDDYVINGLDSQHEPNERHGARTPTSKHDEQARQPPKRRANPGQRALGMGVAGDNERQQESQGPGNHNNGAQWLVGGLLIGQQEAEGRASAAARLNGPSDSGNGNGAGKTNEPGSPVWNRVARDYFNGQQEFCDISEPGGQTRPGKAQAGARGAIITRPVAGKTFDCLMEGEQIERQTNKQNSRSSIIAASLEHNNCTNGSKSQQAAVTGTTGTNEIYSNQFYYCKPSTLARQPQPSPTIGPASK